MKPILIEDFQRLLEQRLNQYRNDDNWQVPSIEEEALTNLLIAIRLYHVFKYNCLGYLIDCLYTGGPAYSQYSYGEVISELLELMNEGQTFNDLEDFNNLEDLLTVVADYLTDPPSVILEQLTTMLS